MTPVPMNDGALGPSEHQRLPVPLASPCFRVAADLPGRFSQSPLELRFLTCSLPWNSGGGVGECGSLVLCPLSCCLLVERTAVSC